MKDKSMNKFGGEFWDERYSSIGFVYGTEPNIFFKHELDKLQTGNILLLGEGEGRNAVYAATQGWEVDAVDFSTIGKEKALKLADENNVKINYEVVNLSDYTFKLKDYDAIAIIYLHLKPKIRSKIHSQVFNSLKSNGILILEVFEKDQLGRTSVGPQNIDMLYSKEEIEKDFEKMQINSLEKIVIELDEGEHHRGEAVVLQLVAEKLDH